MMKPLTTLALIVWATTAAAQESGDPERGRALAETHCSECHEIGPQGAAKQYPPSFAAIAAYRPPELIRSRIVYPAFHSPMPRIAEVMGRENIDDLLAYILSLEPE